MDSEYTDSSEDITEGMGSEDTDSEDITGGMESEYWMDSEDEMHERERNE